MDESVGSSVVIGMMVEKDLRVYGNEDWENEKWKDTVELSEQVCATVWKAGRC